MSHAAPAPVETVPPPATGPLDRKRLFTAFCLTPMLAGFYPAIFLAEPSLMPIGLLLAYASTAVFGIPLVAYFDRRGVREWYMYIAGGTACSLPTVLLYAFAPLPDHLQPFGAVPLIIGVLVWGASSGIVFWMIGIAGDSAVSLRSLFDPVSSEDHQSKD
jgi:Na+/melibiose symporter-like transporter